MFLEVINIFDQNVFMIPIVVSVNELKSVVSSLGVKSMINPMDSNLADNFSYQCN